MPSACEDAEHCDDCRNSKDVKGKYGNPSGTGQTTAFHQLGASFGKVLSVLRWLKWRHGGGGRRLYRRPGSGLSGGRGQHGKVCKGAGRAGEIPDTGKPVMVSMTERNLVNTIKTLGAARMPSAMRAPLARSGTSRRTGQTTLETVRVRHEQPDTREQDNPTRLSGGFFHLRSRYGWHNSYQHDSAI